MLNEDEKEGIKWLRDANSRDTGYKMDILKSSMTLSRSTMVATLNQFS